MPELPFQIPKLPFQIPKLRFQMPNSVFKVFGLISENFRPIEFEQVRGHSILTI
jgi:hypothetical protein